jgi:hypothetical protein
MNHKMEQPAANRQLRRSASTFMQNHETKAPVSPVAALSESRANKKSDFCNSAKPTGEFDMEPRVSELETHFKYLRRDMDEVLNDVRTIKHRLAYSAGATAVLLGLLGWVGNSRFDQLVTLISN